MQQGNKKKFCFVFVGVKKQATLNRYDSGKGRERLANESRDLGKQFIVPQETAITNLRPDLVL